ncbi:MAG: hypothetical protein P1U83_19420 [Roseovarius sp.]|nr:hypothetical protein [Roseovarius sp.]
MVFRQSCSFNIQKLHKGNTPEMIGTSLKCEFSVSEAIGQLVIWILLSIVTFGLALFVLPYYFLKGPINRTYMVDRDGSKIGKLSVEVEFSDILGHALVWLLLTVVTLGLAYLIYWPAVIKRLLNAVKVTEI